MPSVLGKVIIAKLRIIRQETILKLELTCEEVLEEIIYS